MACPCDNILSKLKVLDNMATSREIKPLVYLRRTSTSVSIHFPMHTLSI